MGSVLNLADGRELASRLESVLAARGLPGIAVGVAWLEGQASAAAGLKAVHDTATMTPRDRLPMSCVMKALISLICLYAHVEGILDIDEDVAVYLPDLGAKTGISLRHLLTHTAGYIEPQDSRARWGYSWDDFIAFFPHRRQVFAPGTVWSYSHTGYAILARVLEAALNRPIDRLLEELIYAPLGIQPELYGAAPGARGVSLHVKSPRTGRYEPMRPPRETGFLRYSISDYALSAEDLTLVARVCAGGLAEKVPHLQAARDLLTRPAIDIPAFISASESESMPVRYCHGVGDYGDFKGLNGSYVGSACGIRFDEARRFGMAVALNAWEPFVRDFVFQKLAGPFRPLQPQPPARAVESFADMAELEGEYHGLMLGTTSIVLEREEGGLLCTVNRRTAPVLKGRMRFTADGIPFFGEGDRELCLAVFRAPDTGRPTLMCGTSVHHRLDA
jgi:CubicO group peptidase (beta-lactamase class C family)